MQSLKSKIEVGHNTAVVERVVEGSNYWLYESATCIAVISTTIEIVLGASSYHLCYSYPEALVFFRLSRRKWTIQDPLMKGYLQAYPQLSRRSAGVLHCRWA